MKRQGTKREIEYQLKQTEIENRRREQERRHELEMFKLLLEHKPMQNQYGSIQTTLLLSNGRDSNSFNTFSYQSVGPVK